MITMDNQQATEFELGYLAGIIDGEGCLSMSPGSRGGWNVGLKIVNTNKLIVAKTCQILRKLDIAYHVYDAHRASNQKAAKRIEVNGPMRLQKALRILLPYIVAKSDEAHLLLEYIDKRLSTPYGEMNVIYCRAVYSSLRELKL